MPLIKPVLEVVKRTYYLAYTTWGSEYILGDDEERVELKATTEEAALAESLATYRKLEFKPYPNGKIYPRDPRVLLEIRASIYSNKS